MNNLKIEPEPSDGNDGPVVDVFIDEQPFDITNLHERYWMADVDQVKILNRICAHVGHREGLRRQRKG